MAKAQLTSGQGKPLLLLHSSLSSKLQWIPLLKRLPEGLQATALDLIGYGDAESTPNTEVPFHLDRELEWIDRQWQCPEKEKAVLVGHSYGGAVALAWALKNPSCVERVVLYEPVLFGLLDKQSEGWKEIESITNTLNLALKNKGWEEATRAFVDYWSGAGTFDKLPPHLRSEFIKVMPKVPMDFEGIEHLSFGVDAVASAPFKIHLMKGELSRKSAHEVIAVMARSSPDIEVCSFKNAGHMGPLTHQADVMGALCSLLI